MTEIYAFRAENWVENQRNIAELFQKKASSVCLPQSSGEAQVQSWADLRLCSEEIKWGHLGPSHCTVPETWVRRTGRQERLYLLQWEMWWPMLLTVWLQNVNSQSLNWALELHRGSWGRRSRCCLNSSSKPITSSGMTTLPLPGPCGDSLGLSRHL